jgi:bifunctional UDP-N-acetylglucosamine pyrophosphorylase / glucosamine-1-phosphate N-acetyltransferase
MEKYAAIILAAGKGTRMNQGQASDLPKVMYEINGKPIIYWSVKLVRDAGIEKVVLVVGYKKELIQDYFGRRPEGSALAGKKVEYAIQEEQLGTGHAASMAKDALFGKAESIVVFGGDNPLFKPETVKKLMESYDKEKPTIAMLSVISDSLVNWAFGRIVRDENNEVVGIVEQKDCDEDQLKIKEGNPAFYIFDADWLWENISKLKSENAQNEIYLTDMVQIACKQGKRIIAVPVSEESEGLGINTPEHQKQAEEILQKRFN